MVQAGRPASSIAENSCSEVQIGKQSARSVSSTDDLSLNFQLLKKKPTGDAYRPPEVERALAIEQEMNERRSTRHVNDTVGGISALDADISSEELMEDSDDNPDDDAVG